MRKIMHLFFLLFFVNQINSYALSPDSCLVTLTSSLNQECLLTLNKDMFSSNPSWSSMECFMACQTNTVTYTANCLAGEEYSWDIVGYESYIVSGDLGNEVTVVWSNTTEEGSISVTVLLMDNTFAYKSHCVVLIAPPMVSSETVPPYFLDDEQKTIITCQEGEISFINTSYSDPASIAGHFWWSDYDSVATEHYTMFCNQDDDFILNHFVINECGCQSETESYSIQLVECDQPQLSCYGTACGGSTATYSLLSGTCADYYWSVTGGSIVAGQETSAITVQWGHPTSGYGTVALDAALCNNSGEPPLFVKIPIIADGVMIEGPTEFCVSDHFVFSLPLWGSTHYEWNITPNSGYRILDYGYANQALIEFLEPGNYSISANYECPFLDCTHQSAIKNVIVFPNLEIESEHEHLCQGDTGIFTTLILDTVYWEIIKNDIVIDSCYDSILQYPFQASGSYLVTATHPDYCNTAQFSVIVHAPPLHITSVIGDTAICPSGSVYLSATPTLSRYYLEWQPLCSMAYPSIAHGNSATFSFTNVCDIAVYQIDAEYGCRSDAYIHHLTNFQLENISYETMIVCAGDTFSINVPNQSPKVLYEWTVYPSASASVQGENTHPNALFIANYLVNAPASDTILISLKREYCITSETTTYFPVVIMYPDSSFYIQHATEVCPNTSTQFQVAGAINQPGYYQWLINGTTSIGNTANRTFSHSGVYPIYLTHIHPFCQSITVVDSIVVLQPPNASISYDSAIERLFVFNQAHCTYQWSLNNNILVDEDLFYIFTSQYGDGNYCCVITDTVTSCSIASCKKISQPPTPPPPPPPPPLCGDLPLTYDSCNNIITVTATNPLYPKPITWSANTQQATVNPTTSIEQTQITFYRTGTYKISARTASDDTCLTASFNVHIDCIPNFEVFYNCNDSLYIYDRSIYASEYTVPVRTFTVAGTDYSMPADTSFIAVPITLPVSEARTDTITMIFPNGSVCPFVQTFTLYPETVIDSLIIPTSVCVDIPFQVSAIITGGTPQSYQWHFGDNSFLPDSSVFHTYGNDYLQIQQTILLSITDENGCSHSQSHFITVNSNPLNGQFLNILHSNPYLCNGETNSIYFDNITSPCSFLWLPDSVLNNNVSHPVYHSGDYSVRVENSNGCIEEAQTYVLFVNPPDATVFGLNDHYCQGDSIQLSGINVNGTSHQWKLILPDNTIVSHTADTFSFTFLERGSYQLIHTVFNTSCSDSCILNFEVHPTPPKPVIEFGSNNCIGTPPVKLKTSNNEPAFWNTGIYGSHANYYTDGNATAYFKDLNTGCQSEKDTIYIVPAPNYDALLTGCYKKCPKFFPTSLQVYNLFLADLISPNRWDWYLDDARVSTGTSSNPTLCLPNFGTYYMEAKYTEGCHSKSPYLIIEDSNNDTCICENISVESLEGACSVNGSKIRYCATVNISNTNNYNAIFSSFYSHSAVNIISSTPLPFSIAANNSEEFEFCFEILDLSMTVAEFFLYNDNRICIKKISIPVDFDSCISKKCEIVSENIVFNTLSTDYQSIYYSFTFFVQNEHLPLFVWSVPPQIVEFDFYSINTYLDQIIGLMMINYGELTQLAETDSSVCIYIYLYVSKNNICCYEFCIRAEDLLDMIPAPFRNQLPSLKMVDIDENTNKILDNQQPYLHPNPATNLVAIEGIDKENISEVQIIDLNRKMMQAPIQNNIIDLKNLKSGFYIVRIININRNVFYLKLVKY